mgnify:CR=1 FL=1
MTILNRAARELGRQEQAARRLDSSTVIHDLPRHEWPDPQPLATGAAPDPYPIDALPEIIGEAVQEVHQFVQAPLPLVAGSAIAGASMAVQHAHNVERDRKLGGPCSVFVLAIAPSGDRKTTLDRYFTSAISEWQVAEAERMRSEIARFESAKVAWELRRQSCIDRIKKAAQKQQDTSRLEHDLSEIELEQPERPRIPHILLGDETPESLAHKLRYDWPSAGIASSEAGIVFGSHGMGSDSIMRNLGLLNVLWDGREHSVGRRSKESFVVRGARLTMALQVQPETLRHFFDKNGDLARGTGFMARFLICAPETTQGTRFYQDPPETWPALDKFNNRMRDLLDQLPELDREGALNPQPLNFSPDAKDAWIRFHDSIEIELRQGGELFDVRDVASKAADNAARLACLFHIFSGSTGPITSDAIQSGSRIAAWHLAEARRFFEAVIVPPRIQDAIDLEDWMIERCRNEECKSISRRDIQRHAIPARLRNGPALDSAITELEDADRARLVEDGRKKIVEINPQIIGGSTDVE